MKPPRPSVAGLRVVLGIVAINLAALRTLRYVNLRVISFLALVALVLQVAPSRGPERPT